MSEDDIYFMEQHYKQAQGVEEIYGDVLLKESPFLKTEILNKSGNLKTLVPTNHSAKDEMKQKLLKCSKKRGKHREHD